jgi:hypothetical protein
LDRALRGATALVSGSKAEKYFFQFLSDRLGQFINEADLPKHLFKALVLCRHIKEESMLWADRGMVALLKRSVLKPALTILSEHAT